MLLHLVGQHAKKNNNFFNSIDAALFGVRSPVELTCSGEQEEDDGQGVGGPVASHGHLSVLMKKRRMQERDRGVT